MKATKEFKIGECALGGIIRVSIIGQDITIQARDWTTREVVKEETIEVATHHLRALLDDSLLDITSSYYAEQVMEWIESKVAVPSYW